jgi:hypothetical protein
MSEVAWLSSAAKLCAKISRWNWSLNLLPIFPVQKYAQFAAHFSALGSRTFIL